MTPDEIVVTLLELGFSPAGETVKQVVHIPTVRSPVFGGLGGERRTIAGRARYILPGTDLHATVEPRTPNLYFSRGGKIEFILNAHTRDLTRPQLQSTVTAATGRLP